MISLYIISLALQCIQKVVILIYRCFYGSGDFAIYAADLNVISVFHPTPMAIS